MKLSPAERYELLIARARLTNPIDRIAFDNRWIEGLPVGLLLLDEDENRRAQEWARTQEEN